MYDVLQELGLDSEDLQWQDLALCAGMATSLFYEEYENSASVAKSTDEACLSCPVFAQCTQAAVENGEWGVWGGIFFVNGKPDKNKNSHKTPEIWQEIQARLK